jgi:RHS repeat-associated protein
MVACAETLTAEDKVKGPFARASDNNIPNGTTDACWFGWQTMEERNPYGGSGSTDTPTKQYVWGRYIDECVQINLLVTAGPQSLPTGYYYPLQDTLYRTMALANSSGAVVEAYDTDAYGNTIIFTGPGPDNTWFTDDDTQSSYGANDIIYQGRALDAESALCYFRTRYYSPALGRFTNRNPWGYIQGRLSLYNFEKNRPIRTLEPTSILIDPLIDPDVLPDTFPDSQPGLDPDPSIQPSSPMSPPPPARPTPPPVPLARIFHRCRCRAVCAQALHPVKSRY